MDEACLFAFLQQQEPAMLLEVLQNAYQAMTTKQRQAVFGALMKQIPPVPVDGCTTPERDSHLLSGIPGGNLLTLHSTSTRKI